MDGMFERLILNLLMFSVDIYQGFFWLGLFSGAVLLAWNAEEKSKMVWVYSIMAMLGAMPLVSYILIPILITRVQDITYTRSLLFFGLWVGCVVTSWIFSVWYLRVGVRKTDELLHRFTAKTSLERNKKSDVREIAKFLPKEALKFDPLKYMK